MDLTVLKDAIEAAGLKESFSQVPQVTPDGPYVTLFAKAV